MGLHKLSGLAPLLAIFALAQACTCATPPPATTAALKPDGERCDKDEECVSGLCAGIGGEAAVCRKACTSGCDALEVCTSFGVAVGGKLRAGCVPEKVGLCQPCSTSADCAYAADVCLSIGGASFCGRDCAFDDKCPEGYVCSDALGADGAPATRQCIPKSATCECLPSTAGQTRPCELKNAHGTCTGVEKCDPNRGFASCDARVPAAESCNGVDDDCNGKVDDAISDVVCGVGECRVTVAGCENGRVPLCTPKSGTAELCNGKDDDCDGQTDEDFDLARDVRNCGACGTVCAVRNGTPKCAASQCAVDSCQAGYGDCDGQYATGCETDVQTDVNHCGGCNNRCNLANANPRCALGVCAIASCAAGWVDADRNPANGCEYQCFPTNGGVEICDEIDNNCDGRVDEGYNLAGDPNNCGACGRVCSVANGTGACMAGNCTIGSCNPGYGDCDGVYGTGCEVNTNTT
ncbi:MAG: MopE-related protein, partial [Myxococcales bacterium]